MPTFLQQSSPLVYQLIGLAIAAISAAVARVIAAHYGTSTVGQALNQVRLLGTDLAEHAVGAAGPDGLTEKALLDAAKSIADDLQSLLPSQASVLLTHGGHSKASLEALFLKVATMALTKVSRGDTIGNAVKSLQNPLTAPAPVAAPPVTKDAPAA